MNVNLYNLRLRTTRLTSIFRGVLLIANAPGAAGWGVCVWVVGGGGGAHPLPSSIALPTQ